MGTTTPRKGARNTLAMMRPRNRMQQQSLNTRPPPRNWLSIANGFSVCGGQQGKG